MKITFLGTGSGVPAKHRNVSSLALHIEDKEGSLWLFDCGEATQHQILHTSLKPRKIKKIFITHLHGDHIFGLPGLLSSRSFQGGDTPLTVYGPKGIKLYLETSLHVSMTHLNYPLVIEEFEEQGLQIELDNYIIESKKLVHGIPSFGYRIVQKDLPGALLMDKVKVHRIPSGPHLQMLKEGKVITLADGRNFDGKEFIGPPKRGKIITILGDTRYTDTSIELAQYADVLVHEATFGAKDELLAKEYFHSTTLQAAKVAKSAKATQLLLTHISARYQGEDVQVLLQEAMDVFPNSIVMKDFDVVEIK
ncbi:ribonuclease Z [Sutcliffiella rhizosphaerae]|uniref:Ribonuclease Z n=1 Tax=Sutcliffiella rhizosphaerae TaxID=2880967 RepID=A0ABM8YNQ4_9BACI|nr:ribonuclease Z [Sutcliffiella rhizosphaerae]CAG9621500.1 Ribonuclease Z [Sutcliffiella rhizosphaerae]